MKTFKLCAGIILIFALGALTGSLGTGLFVKQKIENFRKGGPPHLKRILLKRISNELNLTNSQKSDIGVIIAKMQSSLHELRQKHHPEFQKIIDQNFKQIKEKLNDEQKDKLDHLRKNFQNRFEHPKSLPGKKFGKSNIDRTMRPFFNEMILGRISHELDLTEKQHTEIKTILDQNFEQIRNTLNEEQKKRFDEMKKRPMNGPYPMEF